MDRRARHKISIGAGIALACVATIWHNLADANGAQVVFPSISWWLGQTLRGPGFVIEVYTLGLYGPYVLASILSLAINALFYGLVAATALQSVESFRTREIPAWFPWAVPVVLLGFNAYEAEFVWVCDASNDLLSRPPIGMWLNWILAAPVLVFILPFADGAWPGQVVLLDLIVACVYGFLADGWRETGRPRGMLWFFAIVLGTIAACVAAMRWLR